MGGGWGPVLRGLSRLPPLFGAPQLVCIRQSRGCSFAAAGSEDSKSKLLLPARAASRALSVPRDDVLLALSGGVPDKRTAFSLILALSPTGFHRGLDPRALCPSPLLSSLASYREMSVSPWQGAWTETVEVGVFNGGGGSGR